MPSSPPICTGRLRGVRCLLPVAAVDAADGNDKQTRLVVITAGVGGLGGVDSAAADQRHKRDAAALDTSDNKRP